jgi:hypothetical protein
VEFPRQGVGIWVWELGVSVAFSILKSVTWKDNITKWKSLDNGQFIRTWTWTLDNLCEHGQWTI